MKIQKELGEKLQIWACRNRLSKGATVSKGGRLIVGGFRAPRGGVWKPTGLGCSVATIPRTTRNSSNFEASQSRNYLWNNFRAPNGPLTKEHSSNPVLSRSSSGRRVKVSSLQIGLGNSLWKACLADNKVGMSQPHPMTWPLRSGLSLSKERKR